MSRRHPGNHTIPDNPHWIEFPRTDGSTAHLPKNTTKIVDSEGQVNYMRPVAMDESLAIMWRVAVGTAMAARMNMPKGPNYVLKSFPKGYQLYDHNKGPVNAPRHDPYLCGSINVNRFRSTNEFIPHAIWLMTDDSLNRANCQCKYCTKQPQRIISDTMGLSARRSASAAGGLPSTVSRAPRKPRERRQDRVATKPFAAVRRAPKPLPVGPQQYIAPERDLDVRSSFALEEGHRPRRYRKGELLWYHLDPPIRGRSPEEDITYWPGIVDEAHIKTNALPTGSADGDVDMTPLYAEAADADSVPSGPNEIPLEAPGSVPWRIEQWYIYKVKLLGAACSVFVAEEQVLPYLAYAPSDQVITHVQEELANHLQTVSIDEMDRDIESHMFSYDPMQPEPAGDAYYEKYKRAVAPYTLAIQIASNVAHYWLPTDEWDCKFQVPPRSPVASTSSDPPPQPQPQSQSQPQNATLHSVIEQSLTKNAISPASIAGPNGSVTEPESISMLGRVPRSALPQTVVQTRFQGLWWGTERIWTGELVRLKIARAQFAPKGTDIIYPPAGPSARTLEWYKKNHPDMLEGGEDSIGAGQRGLFLRLEGLVVVDVPTPDGSSTKECRASGMLYEVVDEDWEDPRTSQAVPADAKGKGKARESPDVTMTDSISQGSSFMSQASPLKPPPLPNPDPTVPVSETASSILSQTSPAAAAAAATEAAAPATEQKSRLHSHPVLFTPYPLPPASTSYKFRPILPDGYEVVISLSLISGRYYPGLLRHPLLESTIKQALATKDELSHRHLWALDGLSPGVHQSMDPRYWKGSRLVMFQDADKEARDRFKELWEETKMARLHSQPEPSGGARERLDELWEEAKIAQVHPHPETGEGAHAAMEVD
ncbi:hypothetical protein OH76DRAFT_1405089 [Lentinus brumalis]|uniref:Cryptic loci regulator 2 N-terminal domain-containing protein n=1 Tax=Lentinus brumalis TaxID=2498619 RepID=A0A371D6Q1_9APHY|nr:hypothetical protein OH76DRAFT_1405089 [Polyporus brumalis]